MARRCRLGMQKGSADTRRGACTDDFPEWKSRDMSQARRGRHKRRYTWEGGRVRSFFRTSTSSKNPDSLPIHSV